MESLKKQLLATNLALAMLLGPATVDCWLLPVMIKL